MGLFEKKFCDICGAKINLLGNKKLDDGNCCKECANKLSPWFTGRKKSTVEQIKQQLEYREANKAAAAAFHTTKSYGTNTKLLIDEDAGKFCVTSAANIANANPDILDYSMVTGCDYDVNESKSELKTKDAQGNEVSYRPARYEADYDFYVTIHVNHPYFDDMRFKVNGSSITLEGISIIPAGNPEYRKFEDMTKEIKAAVEAMRQGVRDEIAAANAPKKPVKCPHCGATTTPENGRCEYCGGAIE
ncbi:MAG: DUF4428 domain-containing protein [Clostridia bacterium]|nr:DUF4428 domain-containing protein [Clostridia bacterium]